LIRTAIDTLVEIVQDYPNGITGAMLFEELQKRFACGSPGSALTKVKQRKLVKQKKSVRCDCCGRKNDMYYPLDKN
jgi:hypothetical protein